jgi:nucleotide-binding universal stress UspA family protein
MTPAKTVLVPLDGSVHATAAVPVARRLAELFHATLAVLHVSDDALASPALVDRMKLSSKDVHGLVVDQRSGAAAVSIVQEASERHAALIVMCPQTRMDRRPPVFGSVAEAVLRAALCPVVLVPPTRGRRDWALHQLLLPHDGTPTSAATIGPATQLASMAAAKLVVLHVATAGTERPTEPGTLVSPRYVDQPQHEWPAWAQEFLHRLRAIGRATDGVDISLALAQGEAGSAIIDFARQNDSDLIVLGWRGALEPDRARTMRHVIREAICPVIVFRVERDDKQ